MPSWPKGGDAVFARIYGAATLGLNGHVIAVETDISNGLPSRTAAMNFPCAA